MQVAIKKVRSLISLGANKKYSCNYCRCNGVEMSEGMSLNAIMIVDVDTFLLCIVIIL